MMFGPTLLEYGSEKQKQEHIPPICRGEIRWCQGYSEPGAGSDVRGMKCNAVRDGGDWVINGTKHFISGADHADFIIVFIATGEDQTPRGPKKRITAFLVDRGTPGFTIRDGYKSVSHRGYNNMILEFNDCRLPDAQVLGEVDGGFAVMNEWLYATRITVATMAVGRARRCFDMGLNYAAEREQFGQAIGKFQGVSFQLADMITEIDAADYLTLASAWRLDQGLPANREIASAKVYASEKTVNDTTPSLLGTCFITIALQISKGKRLFGLAGFPSKAGQVSKDEALLLLEALEGENLVRRNRRLLEYETIVHHEESLRGNRTGISVA